MFHKPLAWLVVLLAALALVCSSFWSTASPAPFAYDESDYMYAGSQGVWANYTDRDAMSLLTFVRKGLELSRDKTQRVSMSQYVRSSGDISFYRHYHGPMYAYWIGIWHGFGTSSENVFRASGLVLHALGALAIFWLFLRAFPELPPAAAFVAALMFAMNRTALVTGTLITQHIVYEVASIVTLFTLAIYLRSRDVRWWYATTVLLAIAFATVEISIVLIGTAVLSVTACNCKNWRGIALLLAKGILVFVGSLLVIWPKSVLQLNAAKGYLYLAYIAIYRKTFSPIGPMDLWGYKLRNYSWEFVLPLIALVLTLVFWRKLSVRMTALPFVIYAVAFIGVTMVVTAPYVHYHGSLMAAAAVVTGVGFGEVWNRTGTVARVTMLGAIVGSLVMLEFGYFRETQVTRNAPSLTRTVLTYLAASKSEGAAPVYVPYVLTPPLHYYLPDLKTVGYDDDWSPQRLADESLAAAPSKVLCGEALCTRLSALWPPEVSSSVTREPTGRFDDTGEPVFALSLGRR